MPQRGFRCQSPTSFANPSLELLFPGSSRCGTCSSHYEFRPIPPQTYFFLGAVAVAHAPVTVNSGRFISRSPAAGSLHELILESDPASLSNLLCLKAASRLPKPSLFLVLWPPDLHLLTFTFPATSFSIEFFTSPLVPFLQGSLLVLSPRVTISTAKPKVDGMSQARRAKGFLPSSTASLVCSVAYSPGAPG